MELPVLNQVRAFTDGIDQSPCNGCDSCGTRCTAGIRIHHAEFDAIEAELKRLGPAVVDRVLGQDKEQPIPGTEYTYTACEFRDVERGQCLVYQARPAICRLFGHVEWLPCPIQRVTKTAEGAVNIMVAYSQAKLRTYEEWKSQAGREFSGAI